MSTADNQAIGRRFFEDLLGTGDWSIADGFISPDIVMVHPALPEPARGRESVQGILTAYRGAFPDMTFTVEDVVADEGKAAVIWTMRGTHNGDLFGIPPTGKSVHMPGISVLYIENGMVVKDVVSEDTMGIMRQIGVVPS